MGFMDYFSDLYGSLSIQTTEAEEPQKEEESGKTCHRPRPRYASCGWPSMRRTEFADPQCDTEEEEGGEESKGEESGKGTMRIIARRQTRN